MNVPYEVLKGFWVVSTPPKNVGDTVQRHLSSSGFNSREECQRACDEMNAAELPSPPSPCGEEG